VTSVARKNTAGLKKQGVKNLLENRSSAKGRGAHESNCGRTTGTAGHLLGANCGEERIQQKDHLSKGKAVGRTKEERERDGGGSGREGLPPLDGRSKSVRQRQGR